MAAAADPAQTTQDSFLRCRKGERNEAVLERMLTEVLLELQTERNQHIAADNQRIATETRLLSMVTSLNESVEALTTGRAMQDLGVKPDFIKKVCSSALFALVFVGVLMRAQSVCTVLLEGKYPSNQDATVCAIVEAIAVGGSRAGAQRVVALDAAQDRSRLDKTNKAITDELKRLTLGGKGHTHKLATSPFVNGKSEMKVQVLCASACCRLRLSLCPGAQVSEGQEPNPQGTLHRAAEPRPRQDGGGASLRGRLDHHASSGANVLPTALLG